MRSLISLPLYVLGAACLGAATPAIFQGNSVIIRPSHSRLPAEADFQASNFYCYYTEVGYLSFGWWLPVGEDGTDHRHCKPKPKSYDWYEYSIAGDCTATECRVTVVNYDAAVGRSNSSAEDGGGGAPAFQERYVARILDVGDGRLGDLALSYFDKPGGGFAVGTRRVLSPAPAPAAAGGVREASAPSSAAAAPGPAELKACHDAFGTFVQLQDARQIPLNFTLENPCGPLPAPLALAEL